MTIHSYILRMLISTAFISLSVSMPGCSNAPISSGQAAPYGSFPKPKATPKEFDYRRDVKFGSFEFSIVTIWRKGLKHIIELKFKNISTIPVEYQFLPKLSFVDKNGVRYETSTRAAISLTMDLASRCAMSGEGSSGYCYERYVSRSDKLNPGITREQFFVIEAPVQRGYKLSVMTPHKAEAGFMMQYVDLTGKFFYYVNFDVEVR